MKHPRRGPNSPPIPYGIRSFPGRATEIAGAMLHETRSSYPDREDGFGAEAWASSRLNGSPKKPGTKIPVDNPQWGSMWDILIYEGGTQVFMLDIDTQYAAWTAGWGAAGTGTWAAGKFYIQIEMAHGTGSEPYTAVQLDSVAQVVAELSIKYDFPIVRIPFLTQVGEKPRGIATHAESANGVKLGKSDPGEAFPWDAFVHLAEGYANPDPEFSFQDFQEWKEHVDKYLDGLNDAIWAHQAGGAEERHNWPRP